MSEQDKYECTGPDGAHEWATNKRGAPGYTCTRCDLRIPAQKVPTTDHRGRPVREPMSRRPAMHLQPADEAFADYVMAMNGGW